MIIIILRSYIVYRWHRLLATDMITFECIHVVCTDMILTNTKSVHKIYVYIVMYIHVYITSLIIMSL